MLSAASAGGIDRTVDLDALTRSGRGLLQSRGRDRATGEVDDSAGLNEHRALGRRGEEAVQEGGSPEEVDVVGVGVAEVDVEALCVGVDATVGEDDMSARESASGWRSAYRLG